MYVRSGAALVGSRLHVIGYCCGQEPRYDYRYGSRLLIDPTLEGRPSDPVFKQKGSFERFLEQGYLIVGPTDGVLKVPADKAIFYVELLR